MRHMMVVAWGGGYGHATRCLAIADVFGREGWKVTVVGAAELGAFLRKAEQLNVVVYPDVLCCGGPWSCWGEVDYVAESLLSDIALLRSISPDVVIHDLRPTMPVACEKLGVPHIAVVQSVDVPGFRYPWAASVPDLWVKCLPAFTKVLDEHKVRAPVRELRELFVRGPCIVPSFPELDPIPDDIKSTYIGALNCSCGDDVANLHGRYVFAYGVPFTTDGLSIVSNALTQIRVGLVVGGMRPDVLVGRASDVSVHEFVAVNRIWENIDAVLCHGGHGTCMAALVHGVPLVVVPRSRAERKLNGQRLEGLGCARCVGGAVVDWKEVQDALGSVLRESGFREAATRWGRRIELLRGREALLNLVDTL